MSGDLFERDRIEEALEGMPEKLKKLTVEICMAMDWDLDLKTRILAVHTFLSIAGSPGKGDEIPNFIETMAEGLENNQAQVPVEIQLPYHMATSVLGMLKFSETVLTKVILATKDLKLKNIVKGD
jgi:hypothetical protein